MNPLHRGRAIVARSRRPLAWGTLVALWILQAAGALPIDAPSAPDGATTPSSQVVRADAFDDFLESLFGDPDDPPPPPEPEPEPEPDPPASGEGW